VVDVPEGWEVVRARLIEQMICTEPKDKTPDSTALQLAAADIPEMLALTAATEPGPFLAATTRMGGYWGLRSADGRLMAMAGERLKPRGFVEISAVCTDPEFRGRGHARSLVRFLMDRIFAEGAVPILHVKGENNAKGLYERLGFYVRHSMHLTVTVRRA
jgi:predicted GNAT family acetyltransferase